MLTKFNTSAPPAGSGATGAPDANKGGGAAGWIIGGLLLLAVGSMIYVAMQDSKPSSGHTAAEEKEKNASA